MNKTFERTLFVILAIIGIILALHINGALAAESTKPLKCTYEAGTDVMVFQINSVATLVLAEDVTITVIENMVLLPPEDDPDQSKIYLYRFSAEYDKPKLEAKNGTALTFDEYKKYFMKFSYDKFFMEQDLAVSCTE